MRAEASLSQWKRLYDLTIKIKELEPWKQLWDIDLITIFMPDMEEPCYFSIMGKSGEHFGIGTYVGYDGINSFCGIFESQETKVPIEYVMSELNNLSCIFGSREEVPNRQRKIIKDLGLKFRGKNNWIFFESNKKGYIPYILDEKEVVLLTKLYEQLFHALQTLLVDGFKVDFEEGETFVRAYDRKTNQWVSFSAPLSFPRSSYSDIVVEDEVFLKRLEKKKGVNTRLEIDMVYTNAFVEDEGFDRPINPKLLLLVDHDSGVIIYHKLLTPFDEDSKYIFSGVINYINEVGRPPVIYYRNGNIKTVINDLCERVGIRVEYMRELPKTSKVLEDFLNRVR
jgi:hypothetical protein